MKYEEVFSRNSLTNIYFTRIRWQTNKETYSIWCRHSIQLLRGNQWIDHTKIRKKVIHSVEIFISWKRKEIEWKLNLDLYVPVNIIEKGY